MVSTTSASSPGLIFDGVCKSFGGVRALQDVSFAAPLGQATALIGPNGAGKSTLINLTTGVFHPDAGTISFRGHALNHVRVHDALAMGVARSFQEVRIFPLLSTLENVQIALPHQEWQNPWRALLVPTGLGSAQRRAREKALAVLDRVGLADQADRLASELPFGQQKLLALARLMATDAQMLLLDEPTTGLDPALIPRVTQLVAELIRAGKTLLIVEHDMDVVQEVATWVVVLQGQVIAQGTSAQVLRDEEVIRHYLGRLYGA